jgi:hypothetical protein
MDGHCFVSARPVKNAADAALGVSPDHDIFGILRSANRPTKLGAEISLNQQFRASLTQGLPDRTPGLLTIRTRYGLAATFMLGF